MSSYDTIPDTTPLELVINIYYCLSLPFCFGFFCYFVHQHYHKFYSAGMKSPYPSRTANIDRIACRVGIVKILVSLFDTLIWINVVIAVFANPTPASCKVGWKISTLLWVLSKFCVYVFLFQRGELVSVGSKTKFEKLIQFATLGVPVLGIIGIVAGGGEYVSGLCALSVPSWYTSLIIVLDAGLSCGYLLMFVLKLKNLEQNLKVYHATEISSDKQDNNKIDSTDTSRRNSLDDGRRETRQVSVAVDIVKYLEKPYLELRTLSVESSTITASSDGTMPTTPVSRSPNTPTFSRWASSAEQLTLPAEQLTLPVEQLTLPVEQLTLPAEQLTLPAEQLTLPVEQLTLHSHQVSTPFTLTVAPPSSEQNRPRPSSSMTPSTSALNMIKNARNARVAELKKAKAEKMKEEDVSYRRVMQTHTKITAITCTSTLCSMLLFVVGNGLESSVLHTLFAPIAGLDLAVNIVAIAYMTRASSKQ